jgi:hypothetical protein
VSLNRNGDTSWVRTQQARSMNNKFESEETVDRTIAEPHAVLIDQHYSPQFYAELWGTSASTVVRWFQDLDGVLKLNKPPRNGKRTRVELRIPFSLAMREYLRRATQR